MTTVEATFIVETLKSAFEDSLPSITPSGSVQYTLTPKGATYEIRYINSVKDFGFQFKELCAKRMTYSLLGNM